MSERSPNKRSDHLSPSAGGSIHVRAKRKTRTPAERITDLLTTYLGKKQMRTLDAEDKDVLAGVRAAIEHAKEPA